ncbi:hypothetical protein BT63DRAFT_303939 [Microthyrium microscopicum]|uniref:Nucleotidyl transferase AbiEii/AbiGii toxin family protein n=1 Tax=Microthyrium microscopicum TaxID=703497 RepID=A0A6A6U899_9PEZI|nr:hypothetical protein BT63DRAFT_303939 [Microthyrium microscopicum]
MASRGDQPAQEPGTYTPQQMTALQALCERNVSNEHLHQAALYVSSLLNSAGIVHALMGGWSLHLRGSARRTVDIDFACGCNMNDLKIALKGQPKVLWPAGPTSGVARIFTQVEDQNMPEMWVEVDLLLSGAFGLVSVDEFPSIIELIPYQDVNFPVLNIERIMKTKLEAYRQRHTAKDFEDLIFLIQRYYTEIYEVRSALDFNHRQAFYNAYASRNGPQRAARVKHTLGLAG